MRCRRAGTSGVKKTWRGLRHKFHPLARSKTKSYAKRKRKKSEEVGLRVHVEIKNYGQK